METKFLLKIINLPSLAPSSGHLPVLEYLLSLYDLKAVLSSSDRSLPLELHVIAASPLVLLKAVGSAKERIIFLKAN